MKYLDKEKIPEFEELLKKGEITSKKGHHKIPEIQDHSKACRCSTAITGENNSYRHITIKTSDGDKTQFYHQEPVYTITSDQDIIIYPVKISKEETWKKAVKALPEEYQLDKGFKYGSWAVKSPEGEIKNIHLPPQPVKICREEQVKHAL